MNRILFSVALLAALSLGACQQDTPDTAAAPKAPILLIDSVTGEPIRNPNPWKDAGCDLVTDDEVIQMFHLEVKRDVYNAKTLSGQGFCLRTWMKPDWKERENNNEKPGEQYREFKNTLVTQVINYGTDQISKDQLDMVKRDRKNVYEEEVPGIGDGAVWSTSTTTLLVKKGHLVVSITLDCTDNPHDNLPKAKEIAALALKKMI